MTHHLPLPHEQKLTVVFRVEPGSLGPAGGEQAQGFCDRSQQQLTTLDADFICWKIIPRFDKSMPELEYNINSKRLSRLQAQKYLQVLKQDLDVLEDHLITEISHLIGLHQAATK